MPPDEVLRTVLEVDDNTAAGFTSAQNRQQALIDMSARHERMIAAAAKRSGVSIEEWKQRTERARAAAIARARAEEEAARATERSDQATRRHTSSLGMMAARMIGTVATLETARRSFLAFADVDELMRKIQVQSGDTAQAVAAITPGMRNLAIEVKKPIVELLPAFDMLRERGRLSLQDTAALFPQVARAAKGMSVGMTELAEVTGVMMSNLKISGADVGKVLNMMQVGVEDYQLEAGEMVRAMPRVTAAMREWGMTGVKGAQQMLAHLSALRPSFATTAEAAEALTRILSSPDNEKVAMRLGMTQRGMMDVLRRAGREGKDVIAVYLAMLEQATKNGLRLEDISVRERRILLALKNDTIDSKKAFGDLGTEVDRTGRAFGIMSGGAKATFDGFKTAVEETKSALGELLAQLDAAAGDDRNTAVQNLTRSVIELQKALRGEPNMWQNLWNSLTPTPPLALPKNSEEFLRQIDPTQAQRFRGMPRNGAEQDIPFAAPPNRRAPLLPGRRLEGLGAEPMSFDPEREMKAQGSALIDIRELLRQIKDQSSGQPRVQNASFSPGGGGGFGGGALGGGGGTSSGGAASAPSTIPAPGGGRFNGLGGFSIPSDGGAGGGSSGSRGGPRMAARPPASAPGPAPGLQAMPGAAPTAVLQRAQQMALSGGPQAVKSYMRGQGYRVNDAWCGDFAAAAVREAGGTPPRNPSIASNWRNYGTEVESPQPGDIAVRRQEFHGRLGSGRTGSPGSHVTIVENAGRDTFTGLGGNQGRGMRSQFNRGHYQFFRSTPPSNVARPRGNGLDQPALNQRPDMPTSPPTGLEDAQQLRAELEQPIRIRAQLDQGDAQFRRTSIQRQINRELRDSSWDSYADFGAA